MNYRHAYHAGNAADVLKHTILAALIRRLLDKPSPVFVLDTHAGIGTYDLTGIEAEKTGEWEEGIGRLMAAPCPSAEDYLGLVRSLNPDGMLRIYPGSPAIVADALRPEDRLVLSERHGEDFESLRRWSRTRQRQAPCPSIAVHERDGYEALKAFLPPKEGRGLVIVDPPYEATDEFERLARAIIAGHRRWPAGRWLIWCPIKDRAPVWRLEETLIEGGVGTMLSAELLVRVEDGLHLAGSSVLLINPPYLFEDWLTEALRELQGALAPEHGSHALRRLGNT